MVQTVNNANESKEGERERERRVESCISPHGLSAVGNDEKPQPVSWGPGVGSDVYIEQSRVVRVGRGGESPFPSPLNRRGAEALSALSNW